MIDILIRLTYREFPEHRKYETSYQFISMNKVIHYSAAKSDFGWIMVVATKNGICYISLGNNYELLIANARKMFPTGNYNQKDEVLNNWIIKLVEFVQNPTNNIILPLEITGTTFQRNVWSKIQRIPLGETTTYKEIAQSIGNPLAYRAVARACAANRLALAIPCHRVLRADGTTGGYRWGTHLKKHLLERERITTPTNQKMIG